MLIFLQVILNNPNSFLDADFMDGFIKLMFLTLFAFYVVFAFVVIRQITIMKNTLITPVSPIFTTLGYAHFALSLGALVFFFFLL